jgi:hypothetical protein
MSGQLEVMQQPAAGTPARLLEIAVSQGADMDKLEKLMALQERWEANEARKAFVAAMAAFKSEPLRVVKSKEVNIPGGARFVHATLADVVDAAVSGMGRHGLSHRWVPTQQGNEITVTCVITHQMGHSESVSLTSRPDDSGKKNAIQQVASAITYLERYTLQAALGIAASDMQEDDGRSAGAPVETLTEEQQAVLQDLIDANGRDREKFLQWAKVDRIADIPQSWFAKCKTLLSAKKPEAGNAG